MSSELHDQDGAALALVSPSKHHDSGASTIRIPLSSVSADSQGESLGDLLRSCILKDVSLLNPFTFCRPSACGAVIFTVRAELFKYRRSHASRLLHERCHGVAKRHFSS